MRRGSDSTDAKGAIGWKGATQVEVLSSEPLLVSGGTLVRITLPPGTVKNGVTILAAGRT
jgi:hypothetical protein